MSERRVILIGGMPTAGKSTLARTLSAELQLPWISSDQIRNTMRLVADPTVYPDLFNPPGFDDAELFHDEFSSSQIVDIEVAQSKAAWIGIKYFIDQDYTWTTGFIIEGVNILPRLVARDYGTSNNVRSIFLIDADADRIRSVIFERGLWDDAANYSSEVKLKEVEWVKRFGEWLLTEASACGLPILNVAKDDSDSQIAMQLLDRG